ncbi:hypothetical protein H4R18_002161 [Coemansia javaensis]|uniref:Nucleoporin Pom152 n=1 Tax=Coemansia javaensis TaxID=2761396 RepID=A0A9W8HFX9_9FUNG|nr:hypothetical protein H4R18_002161 [Coemansia javaensis]
MSGHAGTPVGSQGLTPVGSPGRIRRRTRPGSPGFRSPPFPHIEPAATPAEGARSTFAERVYQSAGRLATPGFAGSVYATPAGPARPSPGSPLGSPGDATQQQQQQQPVTPERADGAGGGSRRGPAPPAPQPAVKPRAGPSSALPASVVDLPSQRVYALAVLGLLAAWKLYDAIGLAVRPGQTSFVLFLKWCALDTLLWYAGWRLHIPRLSVSVHAMYVLLAASAFVNLNLFFLSSSVLTLAVKPVAVGIAGSCLRTIKGIPLLGPRLVGDSDLLIDSFVLDEDHILGRHTIHILPHSLAHLNPQGRSYCIDAARVRAEPWYRRFTPALFGPAHAPQTTIPILVNGTRPDSITYVHTSFETGQRQMHTIKGTGALQMEANAVYPSLDGWVLATYHLPVTQVGAYELHSVRDSKGLEFRCAAQAPHTVVVACPQARLQWLESAADADNFVVGSDGHASVCQRSGQGRSAGPGSDGLIQVVAEGYEPIELTIVRLVNGHREIINLDGAAPRPAEDPAAAAAAPARDELSAAQRAALEKWSRFRARKVAYTVSDTFLRPGEYVYRLEGIRDAANHSVAPADLSAKGMLEGDKAVQGKATSYMARIQVHRLPSVGWADRLLNAELPLRLSGDRQRKSRHSLPLRLAGTGPWTVAYTISNGAEVLHESQTFATARDPAIDARRAGTYHLVSVQDQHCRGHAEQANVTLVLAAEPAANISSTPIMAHECGGEIGALVDLELAGRPPFAVHYRERNLDAPNARPITRVVRSQQRRHSFKVMPDLAGTYELEFFRIEDDNYPSGQPIAVTLKQAIHAQPSARLDTVSGRIPSQACLGEALELPVRLKGQGPWELTYNVVHENRRTAKTVTGITGESHSIALGAFSRPGEYTVELVQVKDGNKCARDLLDATATIRVRESGPRVGFQCPDGGVRVLDGEQARIPVHAAGEFPIEIRYRKLGDDTGHVYKTTLAKRTRDSMHADAVLAYGPGEYELVSASDICAGTIDPQSARCSVHVEAKPSAWFITDGLRRSNSNSSSSSADSEGKAFWRLHETCEGAKVPAAFELGLGGSGPWRVEYRVDFWSLANPRGGVPGFADRTTTHTMVALQASTLKTECCEPGLYRYTLTAVSDERYQRAQQLLATHEEIAPGVGATVAEHVITSSPTAALRAYAPDGTAIDTSSSSSSSLARSAFRRKAQVVRHCLTPGQSKSDGDAQTWAKLHRQLPTFRIEFDGSSSSNGNNGGAAQPPFQAWIEVFPASGPSEVVHVRDIEGFSQPVALPAHIASQIGRYHMRLVRTRDARGCEHQYVDPNEVGLGRPDSGGGVIAGGIEIEYIEAPNARPATNSPAASPSRDVCVGDVLAFDLRGLNSWTVEYTYNGARRTASVGKRLFRRIADVAGNFTLARVCHRSANDCCSEFGDLSYAVHDIPSVRVSGGKDVYQDILEGDKVDITMDLVGTPPFTFTWQRRGIGAGAAKVLESHTVKDLDAHRYTISTSSEGVFEVTYVQDRYCQYPKA